MVVSVRLFARTEGQKALARTAHARGGPTAAEPARVPVFLSGVIRTASIPALCSFARLRPAAVACGVCGLLRTAPRLSAACLRSRTMQSAAVRPLCDVTPSAYQSGRRAALRAAAAALTLRLAPARAEEDEAAVRTAVAAALQRAVPAGKAPAVLRLAFHDAGTYNAALGTGGPNASVLFELERPESFGLKRGLRPVQDAAELLKGTAAERLSFADLIQLAGAHAVAVTGGPAIAVPLGRVDTAAADPEGRMPEETLDGPALKAHFAAAGFSARELVALSGA